MRQEKCIDYHNPNYGSSKPAIKPTEVSEVAKADFNDANDEEDDANNADSAAVDEQTRIRNSRARLKERLNWFGSRSRHRLSSFGSSDNLKYVRESFLRSRDKLSCALSPVRGRIGSYQFVVDNELENVSSHGNICVRVGTWQ